MKDTNWHICPNLQCWFRIWNVFGSCTMMSPTCLEGSWSELLYNDKAGVRYVQSPLQRQSDLWVMPHLWRLMDFPLALLPQLSGEKAGLIRWFICTFPPPVMDGTSTFPWNFIISLLHPLCHQDVREKWNRHAAHEERKKWKQTNQIVTSFLHFLIKVRRVWEHDT